MTPVRLPTGTRPPARLVLDELEEGPNRLGFEVDVDDLDLAVTDFDFGGPVTVALTVVRMMQMFTIAGRLQATVSTECCRCLAPARARVSASVRFLLQRKEASDEEVEALEEEDDVDLVDPGAKEVDLAGRLRDALVLELPLRVYCRPDCRGLCPQCGQDLNAASCACASEAVDPRWEALARLRT